MSLEVLLIDDLQEWYVHFRMEVEQVGLGTIRWIKSLKQFRSEYPDHAQVSGPKTRIAIIDVNLTGQPGDTSGLDLFAELRQADPTLPVIVTTGFHDDYPGIEQRVRALGGVFVTKKELLSTIAERIMQQLHVSFPQQLRALVPLPVQIALDGTLLLLFAGVITMSVRLLLLFVRTGIEVLHPYVLIFLLVGSAGMCVTALLQLIGVFRGRTHT